MQQVQSSSSTAIASRIVQYYQPIVDCRQNIVYERQFAMGPSLQKLSKGARKSAVSGIGTEIDIGNCHPQILQNLLA